MIGRLFFVGLLLAAWGVAHRRWSARRPEVWRLSFAALASSSAALILLPPYLGIDAAGIPESREWAAAAVAVVLGLLWVRSSPAPFAEAGEWAETAGAAALVAALAMQFLVQPFRIPSGSMEDTLLAGDRVLVNKFPWITIRRGDALAFTFPTEDPEEVHCSGPQIGRGYLKRVMGFPGDVVEVRDAALFLNGSPAGPEPYAKDLSPQPCARPPAELSAAEYQHAWEGHRLDMEMGDGLRDHFGPVTVPPDSYFVIGDNRDESCDSRFWGPVPKRSVRGRAWFVYWPPNRIGLIR